MKPTTYQKVQAIGSGVHALSRDGGFAEIEAV